MTAPRDVGRPPDGPTPGESPVAPARVKLGHVHLKVRALDPAIEFYGTLLGLRLAERAGDRLAFLASGDTPHHILALEAVGDAASGPADRAVGLRHVGFELPDRRALADAWRTLARLGRLASAVDHRVTRAIYCADPDGNGVELFVDTRADVGGGAAKWRGASVPLAPEEILEIGE